jgi:hypothetical protein
VPGQLIRLSELKLTQTIPVWAGFSLHVLTKVLRDWPTAVRLLIAAFWMELSRS